MKAFRISRAPGLTSDAPYDAFAKLVFEPALESDELFDALRESYPGLKTHTERKKQAVLDFLMEERQAVEQEITAFVQQMGTPAPASEVTSARHSPAYSAASSTQSDVRKMSTSNSCSSSSGRSAGSSPETLSLKDMTSVWTAAGHGKPKIHTRRSMTTREKEEYRRRRQMKACKECRSRKRKCNHDPSDASSVASPRLDAKVKKRTQAAASSNVHPPQSFLSNEFDTSFLADSAFSTTESPMDLLDFSPATGTDGSFDDFLLLPNDDFSSMDFATDPLFQPVPQAQQFSYEPFVNAPQPQLVAPSTGSRSPASTYQSSGMSRSGSNALFSPTQTFDTSQTFNFDLLESTFESGSGNGASFTSDAKQSGLAAGMSFLIDGLTPAPTPTSPMLIPAGRRSHGSNSSGSPVTCRQSCNASDSPQSTDGLQTPLMPTIRARRGANMTATQPIAHLAETMPGDVDHHLPHGDQNRHSDGRNDNRYRRDGMVLGTDPSAGARFGEHGSSLLRGAMGGVDVLANTPDDQALFRPRGHDRLQSRTEAPGRAGGEATPLSSRTPTSANDSTPSSLRPDRSAIDGLANAARLRTSTRATASSSASSLLAPSSLRQSGSVDETRDKTTTRRRTSSPTTDLTQQLGSTDPPTSSPTDRYLATSSRPDKAKNPEREPSGGDGQLSSSNPSSSSSSAPLVAVAISALAVSFVPTLLAMVVVAGAASLIASTARRDDVAAVSVPLSSPSPQSVIRAFARRVGGGWMAGTVGGGDWKGDWSSSSASRSLSLLYGVSRSGLV